MLVMAAMVSARPISSSHSSTSKPRPRSPASMYAGLGTSLGTPKPPKPLVKIEKKLKSDKSPSSHSHPSPSDNASISFFGSFGKKKNASHKGKGREASSGSHTDDSPTSSTHSPHLHRPLSVKSGSSFASASPSSGSSAIGSPHETHSSALHHVPGSHLLSDVGSSSMGIKTILSRRRKKSKDHDATNESAVAHIPSESAIQDLRGRTSLDDLDLEYARHRQRADYVLIQKRSSVCISSLTGFYTGSFDMDETVLVPLPSRRTTSPRRPSTAPTLPLLHTGSRIQHHERHSVTGLSPLEENSHDLEFDHDSMRDRRDFGDSGLAPRASSCTPISHRPLDATSSGLEDQTPHSPTYIAHLPRLPSVDSLLDDAPMTFASNPDPKLRSASNHIRAPPASLPVDALSEHSPVSQSDSIFDYPNPITTHYHYNHIHNIPISLPRDGSQDSIATRSLTRAMSRTASHHSRARSHSVAESSPTAFGAQCIEPLSSLMPGALKVVPLHHLDSDSASAYTHTSDSAKSYESRKEDKALELPLSGQGNRQQGWKGQRKMNDMQNVVDSLRLLR